MPFIWTGADPTEAIDANDYELASVVQALANVTITHIRVWSPASAIAKTNRRGHIWNMSGVLLATVVMTDSLASGWTTHALTTPLDVTIGTMLVVGFETGGNYGATGAAFGSLVMSADSAMCFPQSISLNMAQTHGNGRFHSDPATYPNTSFGTFYGVDVVYTTSAGTAPTITSLSGSSSGYGATVTIVASDAETLSGATYAVDWGDGTGTSSGTGTLNHTYANGGIYGVLASVTDSSGLSDYAATYIVVIPPADPNSPLARIRDAIKSTIETNITSLHCYDTVPDGANVLPAVVVIPFTSDFEVSMGRGTDTWEFDLLVLVSTSDMDIRQDSLDAYVSGSGSLSIRQAIFNNKTLGLSGTDAHVSEMLEYGLRFEVASYPHIGARLRLKVHTSGTA